MYPVDEGLSGCGGALEWGMEQRHFDDVVIAGAEDDLVRGRGVQG